MPTDFLSNQLPVDTFLVLLKVCLRLLCEGNESMFSPPGQVLLDGWDHLEDAILPLLSLVRMYAIIICSDSLGERLERLVTHYHVVYHTAHHVSNFNAKDRRTDMNVYAIQIALTLLGILVKRRILQQIMYERRSNISEKGAADLRQHIGRCNRTSHSLGAWN